MQTHQRMCHTVIKRKIYRRDAQRNIGKTTHEKARDIAVQMTGIVGKIHHLPIEVRAVQCGWITRDLDNAVHGVPGPNRSDAEILTLQAKPPARHQRAALRLYGNLHRIAEVQR